MSLFPIIQPPAAGGETALPLCRECAWDFDAGIPIFRGGEPVEVRGLEAVRVWCWKALSTVRFRHEVYTFAFGCEAESLIGQPYSVAVKTSEATRCVREALLVNPYVTAVREISVTLDGAALTVSAAADTIYGRIEVKNFERSGASLDGT